MRPDFGFPTVTAGPAYAQDSFTEMKPPAIPPPIRNYTPRSGFITMSTVRRNPDATPPVDIKSSDLKRGRESDLARRATRSRARGAPMQRIINCLNKSEEPLSSREIGELTGIPVNSISSYIAKYRKDHPHLISVTAQTGTNRRLYGWIGQSAEMIDGEVAS